MKNKVKIAKRLLSILLVFLFSINSFAAIVSDNDGSAFVTKAEFEALKTNFNKQINDYNSSIDGKIDGAIASYLSGIKIASREDVDILFYSVADKSSPFVFCLKPSDLPYIYGRPAVDFYLFSASATNHVGQSKIVSSKCVEGSITSAGNANKRILIEKKTIGSTTQNVWDSYATGLDKFSAGANQIIKVDNDYTANTKWFPCPAFHINNGQTTTVDTWIGTMYWATLEDAAYSGGSKTKSWAAFNKTTSHTGSSTYTKQSTKYNNIILEKYQNVATAYPVWIEGEFSQVWIPSYTSSLTDGSRVYSETIESAWDASSNKWQWTYKQGRHVTHDGRTADTPVAVNTINSISHGSSAYADTNTGRSGYVNNRYVPVVKYYTTTALYNIYQDDGKAYKYDNTTNTIGYKLDQGIPICEVKDDLTIIWKPKFVSNNNTSTTTAPTLYLKYGPFVEDETGTVSNKINYTISGTEIRFVTDRVGTVFAKWSYGSALDLEASRTITQINNNI